MPRLTYRANQELAAQAPRGEIAERDHFDHLVKRHPCLGGSAHGKYGRLHLPVSPTCNIRCRFCLRDLNGHEDRPGVSRHVLAAQDAVATVRHALELCPEITVVAVAGPGEALAGPHALRALRDVHDKFPHLIGCLSTNGLLLAAHVDELAAAGVRSVTVTVNATDPTVQASICSDIVLGGKAIHGEEAAATLIDAQLTGIRAAVARGVVVKVNTVLVPTINDGHIDEVARQVAKHGAVMINIIPLLPMHEMAHLPEPTCDALNRARAEAQRHLPVFRHCKRCRADACGVPGSSVDFGAALYPGGLDTFSHG